MFVVKITQLTEELVFKTNQNNHFLHFYLYFDEKELKIYFRHFFEEQKKNIEFTTEQHDK